MHAVRGVKTTGALQIDLGLRATLTASANPSYDNTMEISETKNTDRCSTLAYHISSCSNRTETGDTTADDQDFRWR